MILHVPMLKICTMKCWLTVYINFKEDEKGVAIMCKAMEDMRNEAAREAGKNESNSYGSFNDRRW